MDIAILASQLLEKGDERIASLDAHAACGMHTGVGRSINPKVWACEDSLCLHRLPDGALLAAVADAHWGGSSSEALAVGLKPAFERASGTTPERLRAALVEVDLRFRSELNPRDRSETTVLYVHVADGILTYLNVGDSMLLVTDDAGCHLRNRPQGYFVGQYPILHVPGGIEQGSFALRSGQVVLLATDGLETEASGLSLVDVGELLRGEGDMTARVKRLLARAGDPDQGGGRDNLALVAFEA